MEPFDKIPFKVREIYLSALYERLSDCVLNMDDIHAIQHIARSIYEPEHTLNDFKSSFKRFWIWALESRADELGVTTRTVRVWLKRYGLKILPPNEDGNEFLYSYLGMQTRIEEGTREWLSKYREQRLS